MKNYIVLFEEHGARIIKGVNPDEFKNKPNALVNPPFPSSVPPHYWKRVGDQIVTMTSEEQKARDEQIAAIPSRPTRPVTVPAKFGTKHYAQITIISAAIFTLGSILLHFLKF